MKCPPYYVDVGLRLVLTRDSSYGLEYGRTGKRLANLPWIIRDNPSIEIQFLLTTMNVTNISSVLDFQISTLKPTSPISAVAEPRTA